MTASERYQQEREDYARRLRLERFWNQVEAELNARDRLPAWERQALPLYTEYPADVVHAMPERIRARLGVPSASAYIP